MRPEPGHLSPGQRTLSVVLLSLRLVGLGFWLASFSVDNSQCQSGGNEIYRQIAIDEGKAMESLLKQRSNCQPSVGSRAVGLPRWGQMGSKAQKTDCTPQDRSAGKFRDKRGRWGRNRTCNLRFWRPLMRRHHRLHARARARGAPSQRDHVH
jgi:hypothetical protein